MYCIIIGNPESIRVKQYKKIMKRSNIMGVKIIPHIDLLKKRAGLIDFLHPGVLIRIESPGENFRVELEMIRLGSLIKKNSPIVNDEKLIFDKGLILYPLLWYLGWRRYLQTLSNIVESYNSRLKNARSVRFMNPPKDIIKMYDKVETNRLFSTNGINTPPALQNISCYDHLLNEMNEKKIFRVFIKLRYGSSASGIVAYEFSPVLNREAAITTVELCKKNREAKLYNNLRVRKYKKRDEIRKIIDLLCKEGVHVEKWVPKSSIKGKNYDARFVVINKKACHRIARLSSGTITNLHLGNERKNIDSTWLDPSIIQSMEKSAEKAADIFPDSFYSGVDLLLPRNGTKPVILEINSFGDFLNNVTHKNMGIYQYEISKIKQFMSC